MDQQPQQQPTPQPDKPKKRFYKKWWFWVLLFFVVLIIGGWIFYFIGSENYLELKCSFQGKEALERTSDTCKELMSDAGKECIVDTDCLSNRCFPTGYFTGYRGEQLEPNWKVEGIWLIKEEPTINSDGYIVGTCGYYDLYGSDMLPQTLFRPVLREELEKQSCGTFGGSCF